MWKIALGILFGAHWCALVLAATVAVSPKTCKDMLPELAKVDAGSIDRESAFYQDAKWITQHIGIPFAKLVEERLDPSASTHVVMALGGAEHLGNIVERYLQKSAGLQSVSTHFAYLTQKILGVWKVEVKKVGGVSNILMGYEPKPWKYLLKRSDSRRAGNKETEVVQYLEELGVLDGNKIVVVDSGFDGTIPDVVAQMLNKAGYGSEVEGVLLYQTLKKMVSRHVPVYGANHLLFSPEHDPTILSATHLMDEGRDLSDPIEAEYYRNFIKYRSTDKPLWFRKSRWSPARLVRKSGQWVPDTPLDNDPVHHQQYLETVLGIEEAINEHFGSP